MSQQARANARVKRRAEGRPGRPVRGPNGERELTAGDVAVFPQGPAGGHQVINRSDDACRVPIVCSKSPLPVGHYLDMG
jgi:uncharacterized cupin superfamily protein